ncbi:MAG: argininosuccinate synthase [Nitrospinae bacterium]|nr:argininosuccinate synthase [Nitrospinota bacterium]
MKKIEKVVLAYSGGLDTSVILKWLQERYDCEVIAFLADLGQGEDLELIRKRAWRTGAGEVVIQDLREEFIREYVFPMLRANAVYEGHYLLGTSIARPLIAKAQVDLAQKVGADAVAHGSTGKGNDQVRFELTYQALRPQLRIIAPWREWDLNSRQALIEYAQTRSIPVPVTQERPYSCDRNLLHISYEGGILEDPWMEPPAEMYLWTSSPEEAPDEPIYLEVDYERGNPVSLNGVKKSPAELLQLLNQLGGQCGIGRVDMVENRYVGIKSRGVYETPGGTILHAAHRAVESITMDREVMHLRDSWMPRYAQLVYYGYWFSPEREMLQVAIDEAQKDVTGRARVKLYKGNCTVVGRKAERSLYSSSLATFEEDSVYDQGQATGFIHLNALRLRMRKLAGF